VAVVQYTHTNNTQNDTKQTIHITTQTLHRTTQKYRDDYGIYFAIQCSMIEQNCAVAWSETDGSHV